MSTDRKHKYSTKNEHFKRISSITRKCNVQPISANLSLHHNFNINLINNKTNNDDLSSLKYTSVLTERPWSLNKLQKNDSNVNNILNKIKRNLFVSGSDYSNELKGNYSSTALLTSPHVSQGWKCKYSQIYLDTLNQNLTKANHKSLMFNIYAPYNPSKLEMFNRKKKELIQLIDNDYNDDKKPIATNRFFSLSPKNRKMSPSRRQLNIMKEITNQINLTQRNYYNTNKPKGNNKGKGIDKKNIKSQNKYKENCNINETIESKLCGMLNKNKVNNCFKIQETQIHLEKILNISRAPIVFVKKDVCKMVSTQQKNIQDQAAYEDFINVLSFPKDKDTKNKTQKGLGILMF